jgi:hypothetical protein
MVLLVVTGTARPAPVAAQNAPIVSAGVVLAECSSTDGVVDYSLIVPEAAQGPLVGQPPRLAAGQSFSALPLPMAELLAQDTAIVFVNGRGDVVTCGEIGGVVAPDGSLVLGLSETGGSGIAGIAFLAPAPDGLQTNVSLFATGVPAATAIEQPAPVVQAEPPALTPSQGETDEAVAVTDADLAYIAYFTETTQTMADSSERMVALFENPRLGADDWTFAVAAELVLWRAVYAEAQGVVAPLLFAEVHTTFLETLRLMDSASYDYATGLDTFDAALLDQGTAKVAQATALMGEVTRMLEELRQELGV